MRGLNTDVKVEISDSHAVIRGREFLRSKIRSLLSFPKENEKKHRSSITGLKQGRCELPTLPCDHNEEEAAERSKWDNEKETQLQQRMPTSYGLYRRRSDLQNAPGSYQRPTYADILCKRRPNMLASTMDSLKEYDDIMNINEMRRKEKRCDSLDNRTTSVRNRARYRNTESHSVGSIFKRHQSDDRKQSKGSNGKVLPEIDNAGECLNIVTIYKMNAIQTRLKNSRITSIKEDARRRKEEKKKREEDRSMHMKIKKKKLNDQQ